MVTYGDDRSRRFSWTVHPLWNKDLVSFSVSVPERCIPPRLLFFQLLRQIDPRLVVVPIWNGREYNYSRFVDLPDRMSSAVIDAARMAATHSKLAAHAYRAARGRRSAPGTAAGDVLSKVMAAYNSPQPLTSLTTNDEIIRYAALTDDYGLYRLFTFLSYYRELEARYGRSAIHIE